MSKLVYIPTIFDFEPDDDVAIILLLARLANIATSSPKDQFIVDIAPSFVEKGENGVQKARNIIDSANTNLPSNVTINDLTHFVKNYQTSGIGQDIFEIFRKKTLETLEEGGFVTHINVGRSVASFELLRQLDQDAIVKNHPGKIAWCLYPEFNINSLIQTPNKFAKLLSVATSPHQFVHADPLIALIACDFIEKIISNKNDSFNDIQSSIATFCSNPKIKVNLETRSTEIQEGSETSGNLLVLDMPNIKLYGDIIGSCITYSEELFADKGV